MMTWTVESVTVQGFRFYFGVVTWTGFSTTAPWIAVSLWTSCFCEYISLLSETCWVCALALPEIGGIFLPNPCHLFSWIFHGGKAWHVPLFLSTCFANMCVFWDSPSLRKEGSCLLVWGRDNPWLWLKFVLAPGYCSAQAGWAELLVTDVQWSATVSLPSSEKDTELRMKKLSFKELLST